MALDQSELLEQRIEATGARFDPLPPDDGETAGRLALMPLTDTRRPAWPRPDGNLVLVANQDRAAELPSRRAARRRVGRQSPPVVGLSRHSPRLRSSP